LTDDGKREYPPPRGMGVKPCDNCGSTAVDHATEVGGWVCGGCGYFVFQAKETDSDDNHGDGGGR